MKHLQLKELRKQLKLFLNHKLKEWDQLINLIYLHQDSMMQKIIQLNTRQKLMKKKIQLYKYRDHHSCPRCQDFKGKRIKRLKN